MSMYTEIYVKAVLKEDVDDNVINILKYMLGMDDIELEDLTLPSHSLFTTNNWHYMLRSGSYYHIPYKIKLLEYNDISENYYLVVRSDFKNYNGEIGKFFDWIKHGFHVPSIRGLEIKVWLDLNVRKTPTGFNNNQYTYCILDDDSDMLLEQKDNFVKTATWCGLTEHCAGEVITILNT